MDSASDSDSRPVSRAGSISVLLGLLVTLVLMVSVGPADARWSVSIGAGYRGYLSPETPTVEYPVSLIDALKADYVQNGYTTTVSTQAGTRSITTWQLAFSWRQPGKPGWLGYAYETMSDAVKGSLWYGATFQSASRTSPNFGGETPILFIGRWTRHLIRAGWDLSGVNSRLTLRPEFSLGVALGQLKATSVSWSYSNTYGSTSTETLLAKEDWFGPSGDLGILLAYRFGRSGFELEPWGRYAISGFPGKPPGKYLPEVESWFPHSVTAGVSLLF